MSYDGVVQLESSVSLEYGTHKISIWWDDTITDSDNMGKFVTFVNNYCEGQRVIIAITNPVLKPDSYDVANLGEDALIIKDLISQITVDCEIYVNANFAAGFNYWNVEYTDWKYDGSGDLVMDVNYSDIADVKTKTTAALKPTYQTDEQINNSKMGAVIFWINYCNSVLRGMGNSNRIRGLMFEGESSIYNNNSTILDLLDEYIGLKDTQLSGSAVQFTGDNITLKGMTGDFTKGSDPMLSRVDLFVPQYYDFWATFSNGGTKFYYTDALTTEGLVKQITKSNTIPTNTILNSSDGHDTLIDGVAEWVPAPRLWMTTGEKSVAANVDTTSVDVDDVLETRAGSIYKNAWDNADVKTLDDVKSELWKSFGYQNPTTSDFIFFRHLTGGVMKVKPDAYCPLLKVDCTPSMCAECEDVSVDPNLSVSFGIFAKDGGAGLYSKALTFEQFLNYISDFKRRMNENIFPNVSFKVKNMGIYNFRYMPEAWGGPTTAP